MHGTPATIAASRRRWHLAVAVGVPAVLVGLNGWLVGPHAWDDGAITLAFSRTFAETGRIALTAASEQVEGFSSVAWFLLNAAFATFGPGFERAILLSQAAAGVMLGIAAVYLWRIAVELALRPATILALIVTFALLGPSISEIANGMEMTLLAASGLALIHALYFRFSLSIVVVAAAVFLCARFEAMLYYAALLLPLLPQRRWRLFLALAGLGATVVGAQEAWRLAAFGDLLPNTIRAKMQAPHTPVHLEAIVTSRLLGGFELAYVLLPLAAAVAAVVAFMPAVRRALVAAVRQPGRIAPTTAALLLPVAAVVGFAFVTGSNAGHAGRMQFLALPLCLLLAGLLFDRLVVPRLRAAKARRAVLGTVVVLVVAFSWFASARAPLATMAAMAAGQGHVISDRYRISPATYRATALAVDRVRRLARLERLTFLTPDVGGSALCCTHLRIVDIGMLANARLAREGYRALGTELADEAPEVVEVHGRWSRHSGIYGLPVFQANYAPILVDRTRLFIRADVAQRLVQAGSVRRCRTDAPDCRASALAHRYVGTASPADDDAFLRSGTVLVVAD